MMTGDEVQNSEESALLAAAERVHQKEERAAQHLPEAAQHDRVPLRPCTHAPLLLLFFFFFFSFFH
jgi:hypothetical protein